MQARVRFDPCARNPLRRSCVSSARNAGESAICPMRTQPSAEIVRVECAKCRRECDLSGARATLCGDRGCGAREMQASTGDFVVQLEYAEQSVELEAENWRPCSTTRSPCTYWVGGYTPHFIDIKWCSQPSEGYILKILTYMLKVYFDKTNVKISSSEAQEASAISLLLLSPTALFQSVLRQSTPVPKSFLENQDFYAQYVSYSKFYRLHKQPIPQYGLKIHKKQDEAEAEAAPVMAYVT